MNIYQAILEIKKVAEKFIGTLKEHTDLQTAISVINKAIELQEKEDVSDTGDEADKVDEE